MIDRFEKAVSRACYTKVLAWHTANTFYFFFDGTLANGYIQFDY
jgi:hypothetical protein